MYVRYMHMYNSSRSTDKETYYSISNDVKRWPRGRRSVSGSRNEEQRGDDDLFKIEVRVLIYAYI